MPLGKAPKGGKHTRKIDVKKQKMNANKCASVNEDKHREVCIKSMIRISTARKNVGRSAQNGMALEICNAHFFVRGKR